MQMCIACYCIFIGSNGHVTGEEFEQHRAPSNVGSETNKLQILTHISSLKQKCKKTDKFVSS